jgi:hypothetical protein
MDMGSKGVPRRPRKVRDMATRSWHTNRRPLRAAHSHAMAYRLLHEGHRTSTSGAVDMQPTPLNPARAGSQSIAHWVRGWTTVGKQN